MARVTFFDLLGVSDAASPRAAAAARWPLDILKADTGLEPDAGLIPQLMEQLDGALTFRAIRPGASGGQVGLTAEVLVDGPPPLLPLVFVGLPDVELRLLPTAGGSARLFATFTADRPEVIIDALPIEIGLPERLVMPLEEKPGGTPPATSNLTDSFVAGRHDTLSILLRRDSRSVIRVHARIRVTPAGEVAIEPAVPISIGPCRLSGLACAAVHDVGFVATARFGGPDGDREQALEWTRHPLLEPGERPAGGFITVRTADLDLAYAPFTGLAERANAERTPEQRIELVLEDVALPVFGVSPLPAHFTVGLRRRLGPNDDPSGAFDLSGLPIALDVGNPADILGTYLIIEQLLVRSVREHPGATDRDKQSAFFSLVLSDDKAGKGESATIDVTDEWTVEVGWRHDPGVRLFKLFGAELRLLGVRAGMSIQRLTSDTRYEIEDVVVLVGDLEIILNGNDKSTPLTLKPSVDKGAPQVIVLSDLGWRLGKPSLGSLWLPGGAELSAFGAIRLTIEEYGFIVERDGSRYFGLTASMPFGEKEEKKTPATPPKPGEDPKKELVNGLRIIRARVKVRGPKEAPPFLLDGISLAARFGGFRIAGSGMIAEYVVDDTRFREFGLGLHITIDGDEKGAGAFSFAASYVQGSAENASSKFTYLLISAQASPIPIGTFELHEARALFAWNMSPDVGPFDVGAAQPMRLFDWYRSHDKALTLPPTRNMSASGWKPREGSRVVGVGASLVCAKTDEVIARAFILYRKDDDGQGFLAVLEIFAFGSKKPIAYGAFEIDGKRVSLLIGLSIGTANITDREIPLLSDAPLLTGTLYMSNMPGTLAIGRIDDETSWLSLHIGGNVWVFTLELFAGLCLELVDLPEGPRIVGLRVSFTGGTRLLKVGGISFYLTLEIAAGVWRSESKVSGFVAVLEGGIRIDVFWVFEFGASFKVDWAWLGPDPAYRRLSCELRIHTPWWLPDVTFRWSRTLDEARLDLMKVVSTPIVEAVAHPLATVEPIALAVSAIVGAVIEPQATYSIDQLLASPGAPPELPAHPVVAVDSSLAIHFEPTVDDRLACGQNTPPGMGRQASEDVSATYELVELGIRRRPRFTTAPWTLLIDPVTSRLDDVLNVPPNQLPPRFTSPVGLRWNADIQREQKLDPRHLLVNTETPYLFLVASLMSDENLVRNQPGWPCCPPTREKEPRWHTVDFEGTPAGRRAPRSQRFTESESTVRWLSARPPLVMPGETSPAQHAARVDAAAAGVTPFARLVFDQPARAVQIGAQWRPRHLPRALVVQGFRGVKALEPQSFPLSSARSATITLADNDGLTHVLLRFSGAPIDPAAIEESWIDIVQMRYQTVDDWVAFVAGQGRCESGDEALAPGGRFAWLANHDYELTVRVRVAVTDQSAGSLTREISQTVGFATKGLPGLNASDRIGAELDPYIASAYPPVGMPLYRTEPLMVAFNERFDLFAGLDRPPVPADPPERKQSLDWALIVERVGERGAPERITQTGEDWISAHNTQPPPTGPRGPRVLEIDPASPILRRSVRQDAVSDPLVVRFATVIASPGGCGHSQPLTRKSRVLSHDPVDLDAADDAPPQWPGRQRLRASVRRKDSPFTLRRVFRDGDANAFTVSGGSPWTIVDGVLGPSGTSSSRQFAIFGDATWRHLQISATLRTSGPGGEPGIGGIAVGVADAAASGAIVVLVDRVANRLRVLSRSAGVDTELKSEMLAADATGEAVLEVTAFDDAVRARVGDVSVTAPRGGFGAGRVALVTDGAVRFAAVSVEGLDAWRFEAESSRYIDFADHVQSASAQVSDAPAIAPPARSLATLVQEAGLGSPNQPPRTPAERQRLFDEWVATLALPLRQRPERIEIGARRDGSGVELLLIEGPEPLLIGGEVTLRVWHVLADDTEAQVNVATLSDGAGLCTLVVAFEPGSESPMPLPPGRYRLQFTLDRVRYGASGADPAARLQQDASLTVTL